MVCCKQVAGDMLCADQNFDIAQVIRFFKSTVRGKRVTQWHISNVLDSFGHVLGNLDVMQYVIISCNVILGIRFVASSVSAAWAAGHLL